MSNAHQPDPNRRVSISLPASVWIEIEQELRSRGVWWLANHLVNTNSAVFKTEKEKQ